MPRLQRYNNHFVIISLPPKTVRNHYNFCPFLIHVSYIIFESLIAYQMSIASTYFIKAQIPGTTIHDLLKMYEREILIQGAEQTFIRDNVVEFSGRAKPLSRYGNKFANFSEGRLIIEETATEFEVFLEAESPKWIFLFSVYFTSLRDDLERELQSVN